MKKFKLRRNFYMLLADSQLPVVRSEDDQQRSLKSSNNITAEFFHKEKY
jgi:hypothetical protein